MGPHRRGLTDELTDPYRLGPAYAATLTPSTRRRHGVHYTPASVAQRLVAIALADHPGEPTVCDPCVGGGVFLLAAADQLAARGIDRVRIAEHLLRGSDTDPDAAEVTRAALTRWAGVPLDRAALRRNIVVADALADHPHAPSDVVVGNPPFLGQLTADTARTEQDRARLSARFGEGLGYADTAGLFLLAAIDLATAGGTVVLIQPESLLAARDGKRIRAAVLGRAALTGLWVAGEPVFDGVAARVCAPVLRRGLAQPRRVMRWAGTAVKPLGAAATTRRQVLAETWAPVAALDTVRVPVRRAGGTVGDLGVATAGFRQHFYGLVGHVVDGGNGPPLVTAGLVDPGISHWGRRPACFNHERYDRPTVETDGLDDEVAGWVRAQRRPKVVVATQTRVLEVAVDAAGEWVASVPTVTLSCDRDDVWRAAAALLAPPVSAWALENYGGTALATGAIKLSARQVVAAPLPMHRGPWDEAAGLLAASVAGAADESAWRRALVDVGGLLTRAHGLPANHAVLGWWCDRLPRWRRSG